MNLAKEFQFPVLSDADLAFSTIKINKPLLREAVKQGFYNGNTPYNELFNTLMNKGGTFNYKENLDPNFKLKATRYLRALMTSWEPKHEEKEAVSALILSQLVEL